MADNGFGEYRPQATALRCSGCDLCRGVCPFEGCGGYELAVELFGSVPGIRSRPETGFYLGAFMGGVIPDSLRYARSSGGLATWVLAQLMENGFVDRAIAVASFPDPDRLFDFTEFTSPEELRRASGSSYYPVEISSCLRAVADSGRRYAIIGLPCVVRGIRKAQSELPRLRRNIVAVLGLVCGQQRGKWFAEYLVRRLELNPKQVRRVSFREKSPDLPSYLPRFAAWCEGRETPHILERHEGYARAWGESLFKQDACNYCDDVFAELADAAFMDAWLPEVQEDPRGTSIVLARTQLVSDLLEKGRRAGDLDLRPVGIEEVVRSQQGCLTLKGEGAALQLSLRKDEALDFQPRVKPSRRWRIISRFRKAAENLRMAASKEAMAAQRASGLGLDVYHRTFRAITLRDQLALRTLALLAVPKRALRKALREGRRVAVRLASHRQKVALTS